MINMMMGGDIPVLKKFLAMYMLAMTPIPENMSRHLQTQGLYLSKNFNT